PLLHAGIAHGALLGGVHLNPAIGGCGWRFPGQATRFWWARPESILGVSHPARLHVGLHPALPPTRRPNRSLSKPFPRARRVIATILAHLGRSGNHRAWHRRGG